MKCLILAAGYATRLYPLTENFPKPLLPVGGKPILDWLIEDIERAGVIDEYIVISNHKFAHHFEDWKKTRSEKISDVADGTESNETRLGAVRDIQFTIEEKKLSDDLFIIAGDNLLDFSLCAFLEYAEKKNASAILRYYEPDEKKLLKCGVVTVDGDDRILRMTEKSPTPETHWCTPPFYCYKKEDAARVGEAIADGCGVDAPGSFVAWLASKTPVYAMEMPGSRYDIGNLESYETVQKIYKGIAK